MSEENKSEQTLASIEDVIATNEQAWEKLQKQLESQEAFDVVVTDVVKGGLVVDVGVRGFIPASMVERHFVQDFSDYTGRTLRVIVKELDREHNKVILSQKDVLDAQFETKKQEIMARLEEGQVLEGTVQRMTNFGAFVDIGGLDGLVHVSEIAWNHVKDPSDVLSEGANVLVKVLKVDREKGKISLSIKEAMAGPWENVSEKFKTGDIVSGVVRRLVGFGAFVEISPGVEGLVHISQISHEHIDSPEKLLQEGQQVQVKILDIDVSQKRVSLSIKDTQKPDFQAPPTKSVKHTKNSSFHHSLNNPNVSLSNQGLSVTLAERFGNKLDRFK